MEKGRGGDLKLRQGMGFGLFIIAFFLLNLSVLANAAERSEVSAANSPVRDKQSPSERVGGPPSGASFVPEGLQEILADKTVRLGDRIQVDVYPQAELSSSRYVDNDGYIYFPYLDKVKAAGLTIEELGKQMTDALGKGYLQNPKVYIRKDTQFQERMFLWWKDAYTKPINTLGEINNPGAFYPLRDDVALIEVISNQGSFRDSADLDAVRVIRLVEGKEKVFLVRVSDVIRGEVSDFVVKKGDLVIVPRKDKQLIYVFGEVNRPGPIDINELLNVKMTLVEVMSLAGGVTRSAAASRVRIIRVVEGEIITTKVNMDDILKGKKEDILLKAGDIIVVPEAYW